VRTTQPKTGTRKVAQKWLSEIFFGRIRSNSCVEALESERATCRRPLANPIAPALR
jgi:hypothetical protein